MLGPLLFLFYVNDLKIASNLLDPIMFADNTNLFLIYKDISYLFETAKHQLERISQWFILNKFSLNVSKTKYSFFFKVLLSETVCGIFYFPFRFVFIKVYISFQENA